MAVEEASFITITFSISFGLRAVKMATSTGEPSRIKRGVLDALMELTPRRRMDTVALGSPELVKTCRPATFPWRASPELAAGMLVNASDFTRVEAPTTELIFLALP